MQDAPLLKIHLERRQVHDIDILGTRAMAPLPSVQRILLRVPLKQSLATWPFFRS